MFVQNENSHIPHDSALTKHLLIDSRNSRSPSTPYETSFSLNLARDNDENALILSLVNIEIPAGVPPINEFTKFIGFVESTDPNTVLLAELTEGTYTGTTFATEIQTQLNAVAVFGTFTVSYDASTMRLTVVSTVSFKFVVVDVNNAGDEYDPFDEMGFDRYNLSDYSLSKTGDSPINLSGTNYITIHSNLPSKYILSNGQGNVLCKVPIPEGFGYVVSYNPPDPDELYIPSNHLSELIIWMKDSKNRLYKLPPTMHWSLTFRVTKIQPQHNLPRPHLYQEGF